MLLQQKAGKAQRYELLENRKNCEAVSAANPAPRGTMTVSYERRASSLSDCAFLTEDAEAEEHTAFGPILTESMRRSSSTSALDADRLSPQARAFPTELEGVNPRIVNLQKAWLSAHVSLDAFLQMLIGYMEADVAPFFGLVSDPERWQELRTQTHTFKGRFSYLYAPRVQAAFEALERGVDSTLPVCQMLKMERLHALVEHVYSATEELNAALGALEILRLRVAAERDMSMC